MVEDLVQFQQNRRVIEDFAARTLAAISTDYGRLFYVASLRDLASGRYRHEGLMALYSEAAVQQALAHCHEELFERVLETPLTEQEGDLRACLGTFEDEFWEIITRWQDLEFYRIMLPRGMPVYLRELFCSNVCALLAIFAEKRPSGQLTA
jgi:hypothetical protein